MVSNRNVPVYCTIRVLYLQKNQLGAKVYANAEELQIQTGKGNSAAKNSKYLPDLILLNQSKRAQKRKRIEEPQMYFYNKGIAFPFQLSTTEFLLSHYVMYTIQCK